MKKSFFNNKKRSLNFNNKHHDLSRGKRIFGWTLVTLMSLVIVAVIVIAGTLFLYRDANNQAKEKVATEVEKANRPKEPVYDQSALNQSSNHATDKKLVKYYNRDDYKFVKQVKYDPKKDVANVTLNQPAMKAVKYASNAKKTQPKKLTKSLKTGIEINDVLSNQAVEIANQAHDGYFTYKFTNANNYQVPNTKTGNYNE